MRLGAIRTQFHSAGPINHLREYARSQSQPFPLRSLKMLLSDEYLTFLKEFMEHIAKTRMNRSARGLTTLGEKTLETYFYGIVRYLRQNIKTLDEKWANDRTVRFKVNDVMHNLNRRRRTSKDHTPKRTIKHQWFDTDMKLADKVCRDMLSTHPAKGLLYGAWIAICKQSGQRPGQFAHDQV